MSRVINSLKWSTVSTVITIAVSMLQLMILTHQLPLEVFGQFAILNLIIAIFTSLSLGGISNYLIHKNDLTQAGKNSVYFLALSLGLLFMGTAYHLSPYILMLFGYPELVNSLKVLSVLLLIHAVSAQYQALGIKAFSHDIISKVDIAANLFSFTLAMLTVDLGLLCLVIATIGSALFRMIFLMIFLSKHSKLSMNVSIEEVKSAFHYGKYNIGGELINIIRRQMDVLILSVMLPVNELGIYHVIKQLAAKPGEALQPIVSKIAMPLFSEGQKALEELKRSYLDILTTLSFALAIIYTPLIALSEPIVSLLFGGKYAEHHIVLSLLSCFWYLRIIGPTTMGALIQATGKTKLTFYWNLVLLPISVVLMFLAASYSVYAVCATLFLLQLILLPLSNQMIVRKVITIKLQEQLMAALSIIPLFLLPLLLLRGWLAYLDSDITHYIFVMVIAAIIQIVIALLIYQKVPFFREPLTRLKSA